MWEYKHTDELYHYGVLGMRWGVRRGGSRSISGLRKRKHKSSPDSKEVSRLRKKRINEMSNDELKTVNKRLEMESRYKELSSKRNVGKTVVQAVIATGTTIAALETAAKTYQRVGNYAVSKLGKKK